MFCSGSWSSLEAAEAAYARTSSKWKVGRGGFAPATSPRLGLRRCAVQKLFYIFFADMRLKDIRFQGCEAGVLVISCKMFIFLNFRVIQPITFISF